MYQLVNAYGILRDAEGLHQPAPIENLTLFQVFSQYSSIYAIVTTDSNPTQLSLDLYKLPYQVRYLNMTLQQWFATIGNASLETGPVPTGPRQAFAQYWNLHQEDFDIRLANRGIHPTIPLTDDQEIDVLVSKSGAKYQAMAEYGLLTVNGFLHRLDYNDYGAYGIGAGRSRHHSGKAHIGLLDFQHIAKLKVIPITSDMLYKRDDAQPFSDAVYLKLPENIGQRQVLLSLGGWLHAKSSDYLPVADNLIKFNFKNYPWFKRWFETKDYLDLSSLAAEQLPNGAWLQSSLYSDDVISKWFTLPQSFIILIDTPQLDVGFAELEPTQLPGRYYSSMKPTYPVVVGNYRLAESIVTFERHKWVIAVDNYLADRLVFDTVPWREQTAIEYRRESAQPMEHAQAKFLMISKLLETTT